MTSEKGSRKDKNQNIQVFVRLRPLNQRERDIKSLGVVEVANNREVIVKQSQQTSLTKKFTFDRAFAPNTKQVEVYQEVVSPLIEEVLAGYNCTVFAYGQTGTGKTHTMVGEGSGDETTWQNDPLAGIIPRALSQLFDELRLSNTEYTVRVSYLELYNEELFDLLSSSEDNSKLRIYEDVTRKGSNIVNGLEEITVYNKNEVYKIMAQGQERKRVASTLMNAQSSRSHTVFTIVVHMKENSPEGEELVKIGKLNLVDLAGSENISKAGSDNPAKRERARECVNINQSLLTLGRVITALVERHPHIPYRESKLTRILQESLGGKTKTSIIATISPGHKDLEETMSTLEYAHRAKNIQNRPEVNQKMTKKAILKEYAEEIDRLKRDLQAARDKNGVYLANETYAEMTLKQEQQRKEIQELLLKKKAMEDERDRMVSVFEELNKQIAEREVELCDTKNKLNDTHAKLVNTNNVLRTTKLHFEETKHLVSKQAETEHALSRQARELLSAADAATTHVAALHDTVDRRKSVESTNLEVTREFRNHSSEQRAAMAARVSDIGQALVNTLDGLLATCDNYTTNTAGIQEENKIRMEGLVQKIVDAITEAKTVSLAAQSHLETATASHLVSLSSALGAHSAAMQSAVRALLAAVADSAQRAHAVDPAGNVSRFVQQWYSGAVDRVTSLQRAHATFAGRARDSDTLRQHAARRQRDCRRQHADRRTDNINACIKEIEEEKALIERRLDKQLSDIDAERQDTERRLGDWMEEQRRVLEEQLAKHVASEKQALENRLSKKMQEIEEERKLLEERIEKQIARQKEQLAADQEDIASAEADLEESSSGRDELLKCMNKYNKQFEEGTSSISIDMEVFSKNVVEVVEHITGQLVNALTHAQQKIEADTRSALESEKASSERLTEDAGRVLGDVADTTRRALHTVLQNIEENNNMTIQELSHLASSAGELAAEARQQLCQQAGATHSSKQLVSRLQAGLNEDLDAHADLEERYLAREYKVYNPSGSTPLRAEYRYPRALAATSPHDRLLARYRALRHADSDIDCILIESANNTLTSDAESSTSEDSAVVFAAPSPPDRGDAHIVKSVSETDIYRRRDEQNGKENNNRFVPHKKPSKLPAPTSLKKPLVERNAVN